MLAYMILREALAMHSSGVFGWPRKPASLGLSSGARLESQLADCYGPDLRWLLLVREELRGRASRWMKWCRELGQAARRARSCIATKHRMRPKRG